MEFGDLSDNPFARVSQKEKVSGRRSLLRAFQVFVLATVAAGAVLIVTNQSKRWVAGRLTADFDSLSPAEKILRLNQLEDLGPFGVEPLVLSLADKDASVARAGYELLRTAQNDWTVLSLEDEASRHKLLVESLKLVSIDLPEHRIGWGTSLLQQTLVFTAEHPSETGTLPQMASNAIDLFAMSRSSVPSGTAVESSDEHPGGRIAQGGPLPVDSVHSVDEWTTWPPDSNSGDKRMGIASANAEFVSNRLIPAETGMTAAGQVPAEPGLGSVVSFNTSSAVPTVYKSGASRLQVVGKDEDVQLTDVANSLVQSEGGLKQVQESAKAESLVADGSDAVGSEYVAGITEKQPQALADSPMTAFDDASVMRWLASPHAALREKAKLELVSRGFDGTEIAIATRIYTGEVDEKLELADALAGTAVLDPRPWLLLLLQDPDRAVRLRAISSLVSMDDPAIAGRLQTHLTQERDPAVASRIRRVLNLR